MSAVATESAVNGWRTTPLKAEVTLKNGKAYNAKDWKKEGYPIIRIQNLKNPLAEFNYFQGDPETQIPVRDGDLVFSWSGSKGTSFGPHIWRGELGVLNQHIFKVILKPDSKIGKVFLYYALRFLTAEIESKAYGLAALVHVRKGDLEATPIPLPSFPEQKKITHILSTVQRAIEAQERIIQTTTELKKALMHKLFTEGLRNEPQKQTEIGPVPESWEVVPFDQFATLQRGYDLRKQDFREGEVPVIGATQVIGYHDTANVKAPGVTVVRSGSSAGKSLFISEDFWAHNVLLFVKEFHGNVPKFVYYKILAMDLTQYRQGVAVPTLNRNTFSSIELALPCLEEQQEVVDALDSVGNRTEVAECKKAQLQDLFRTLLHELMTAKIRVNRLDFLINGDA